MIIVNPPQYDYCGLLISRYTIYSPSPLATRYSHPTPHTTVFLLGQTWQTPCRHVVLVRELCFFVCSYTSFCYKYTSAKYDNQTFLASWVNSKMVNERTFHSVSWKPQSWTSYLWWLKQARRPVCGPTHFSNGGYYMATRCRESFYMHSA